MPRVNQVRHTSLSESGANILQNISLFLTYTAHQALPSTTLHHKHLIFEELHTTHTVSVPALEVRT